MIMDLKIILQIVGAVLGIIYLLLEFRANIWLWVIGIIMPIVHGILYFKSGLYADFGMEVYYVLAGLWGLTQWHKKKEDSSFSPQPTPLRLWLPIVAVTLVLNGLIYLILVKFTDSTVPYFDSLTTALSITALWMLSRKYLEQWLVWLLVDLITTGLYTYKTLYITAGLYMIYSVMAVIGYRKWKNIKEGLS